MAFQPVLNCAEAVIQGTVASKAMANVLGFRFSGAYLQADIDALAAAVDGAVGSDYKPIMTAGMSYDGTLVRGLTTANDLTSYDNTSAGAGGVSGAQLPNNVTLCATLRSGLTGRSARGRFYAFPTGISQLSAANIFAGTYGTALLAAISAINVAAALAGWQFVIISRFTGGAARPTGVVFPVTQVQLRNTTCDSQRGRLPVNH